MADWMKTVDQVDDMTRAAGSGDFGRVAFEYKTEKKYDISIPGYTYEHLEKTIAKFAAPVNGVYKYSFEFKLGEQAGRHNYVHAHVEKYYFIAPLTLSEYMNSSNSKAQSVGQIDYAENYITAPLWEQSPGGSVVFKQSLFSITGASLTSYVKYEHTFYVEKGQLILFHIDVSNTAFGSPLNCSMAIRNQKITY